VGYGVYSTTFCRATTNAVWAVYTVPAGKRAVVKAVTGCNLGPVNSYMVCTVAGIYVVLHYFPASNSEYYVSAFAVAKAGEEIRAIGQGTNMQVMVSGYLLHESEPSLVHRHAVTYEPIDLSKPGDQLAG
jgi:hypothetical protein